MKGKYYLRGIGVGILFATIVLFTAYSISNPGTMTDEEIMDRAEKLGMTRPESVLDNLSKPAETETPSSALLINRNTTGDTTQDDSEDTTEETTEGTEAPTTTRAPSTQSTTEAPRPNDGARVVTFTIVSGMNSWNVATILQDQGVIDSAAEFDDYLEANGYSARISTGEYSITVGSDYETIAKMLTGN